MQVSIPKILKQKKVLVLLASFVVLASFFLYSHLARAATRTWDGGGSTNDWSDCANWSSDTCPTSADIAVFDATSGKDATIDASFGGALLGLSITSGYTGTITQSRSLTVTTSGFSQAGGTYNQGDHNISENRNFSLTGGTFTAGTGVVNLNENASNDDGTFTCSGTFPGTINIAKSTFNSNLSIASGCSVTTVSNESSGGTVTVDGTITFSGTTLAIGGLYINNGGTVNATSLTSATFEDTLVSAALSLSNGSTLNTSATSISIDGSFTLGSTATFDASGRTFYFIGGDSSYDDTTFTCTGTFAGTVDLAKSSYAEDFSVASGCSVTTVSNESSAASVFISGTITFPGTSLALNALQIYSGGTVNATGLTSATFSNGLTSGSLTINNGSTFNTSATSITTDGNFTIGSTATFDPSGKTFTFNSANASYDDSTFTCSGVFSGTVAIAKTISSSDFVLASGCEISIGANTTTSGPSTINGTLNILGYNYTSSNGFTLTGTGRLKLYGSQSVTTPTRNTGSTVEYTGSGTYTTLPITGTYSNIQFSSGTYNLTSSFTVAGNFSNTGATFNQTSGTVTFTGSANTISGDNTFYNLTKSVSSPSTLTFPAGDIQVVSGTLTLTGTDGSNRLTLQSSTPTSQWSINPSGARSLNYLAISDGNNTNNTAITCYGSVDCVDGGNNTNILFAAPPPPDPEVRLRGGMRLLDGVRLR